MPEPTAAAAQYASRASTAVGERIAVYDLGGGTFDACVITRSADGFKVLGDAEGIERLGGIDFDRLIFEHVLTNLGGLSEVDPESEEVVMGLSRLRRDCVDAKEALSEDVEAKVPLTIPGLRGSIRITRSEVESLVRPRLSDTHESLRKAMRSAGVRTEDLSALVLVGGSSRMPIVGQLLTQEFGLTTSFETHPKHDVALGALQPAARTTHRSVSTLKPASPQELEGPEQGQRATGRVFEPTTPASRGSAARTTQAPIPPPVPPSLPDESRDLPKAGPSPPRSWVRRPLLRGPHALMGGGGRARKGWIVLAVGVALVVLGAILVVTTRDEGSEQSAHPTTVGPGPQEPAIPAQLPQGSALSPSEMLLERASKGGDRQEIWAADTATNEMHRVTPAGADAAAPVMSPDRKTLVYTRTQESPNGGKRSKQSLRVIGVDGRHDRKLFSDPSICPTPQGGAWDPTDDGRRIVLSCGEVGKQWLTVVDTDGTHARKLVQGRSVRLPSVSPDGKKVAYCAARGPIDCRGIWVRNMDGSDTPIPLAQSKRYDDSAPVWSPDGKRIAFKRLVIGQSSDIWTMAPDGTEATRLTGGIGTYYHAPTWSEDGEQIAYVSSPTGPFAKLSPHIYRIDALGGEPERLWPEIGGRQSFPTWARR